MKKLLAYIMFYSHNIHILHWKVVGEEFQANHEHFDEYYKSMIDHIDLVAEMMLQLDQNPIDYPIMLDIVNTAGKIVDVDVYRTYSGKEAFVIINEMYLHILGLIESLHENMGNELPNSIKSTLDEIESWYRIRAKYLIPSRLKGATESTFEIIYKSILD